MLLSSLESGHRVIHMGYAFDEYKVAWERSKSNPVKDLRAALSAEPDVCELRNVTIANEYLDFQYGVCASCGFNPVPAASRFCPGCGATIKVKE